MYGGQFQKVDSWEQFRKAVGRGLNTGGLHVIEVPTERTSNVKMHRQLWELIRSRFKDDERFLFLRQRC